MRNPRATAAALAALAILAWAGGGRLDAQTPADLGFRKSFAIEIVNPAPLELRDFPVVILVEEIRRVAADFNGAYFAVFDRAGGGYALVSAQADDLDRDRVADEIVLIRTLPPSSTLRLTAYYNPKGSFQMMMDAAAGARAGFGPGRDEAGWESDLAAFHFAGGWLGPVGKLREGLVLRRLPAAEKDMREWGATLLEPGGSAGLGGLSLWTGDTRVPLYDGDALRTEAVVRAQGPIRALVDIDCAVAGPGGRELGAALRASAFAGNAFSRQDVAVTSSAGRDRVLHGPGIRKLDGDKWILNEAKGYAAAWGRSRAAAGEIGLAVIFRPDDFVGLDETADSRFLKLSPRSAGPVSHWLFAGWSRGLPQVRAANAAAWELKVAAAAERLLVPVRVTLKPE